MLLVQLSPNPNMPSNTSLFLTLIASIHLLLHLNTTTAVTTCPDCGPTKVPYPLSTNPSCGDSNYKIQCTPSNTLSFPTLNNAYPITSISPHSQRLTIRPADFSYNNNTCVTADLSTTQGVQLNASLPFFITSNNTILYLNCSDLLLRSPLNCSSSSLCHAYVNHTGDAAACRGGLCCTFRAGGSTTAFSVRVRETGCRAYRSFVNLEKSLAVGKWPAPGLQIQWELPPQPVCGSQGDCDSQATCEAAEEGLRRCFCKVGWHWNPVTRVCAVERNGSGNRMKIVGIALGAALTGGILLICVIIYARKSLNASLTIFRRKTKNDKDVEAVIKQYGSSIIKRYTYYDVKNITSSFKYELGKGGYGNVFEGKLPDCRAVAVKVLNVSKGNGEDFINEVASIGRTSHINVVTLLGFCYDGRKRALIYEFMPNGSLEKFIDGETKSIARPSLGCKKLYDIALGISRGLEYLHHGCNTRILHLDIKPQNILLDENFSPKISDFGLAKLHNRKGSKVSTIEARGTIGYIAPEVFNKSFGRVSHKSDVYSYGMMILEMFGGKKNGNGNVVNTSEIYFPHWIYRFIEVDERLDLGIEMSVEENEIARKMIIVGLWCIQTYPSERPSISKVIEMLEGSISALEIPPKPYLCSPRRSTNSSPRAISNSFTVSEVNSIS